MTSADALGHGVRRETAVRPRLIVPPHAVPVLGQNHPSRDGHGVGRRTGLFGHRPGCCAVQPHAPTGAPPIVGAWGAAGSGDRLNADRSFRRTPCPSGITITPPGTGTALDGERACFGHRPSCCAVQPHAPTDAPPIVGAWGAAGNGFVSTPIDRSAARRARLGSQSPLSGTGTALDGERTCLGHQPDCCAVQPHAPTNPGS